MIHEHLKHAAGVAETLRHFDIEVIKAHANVNGAQLIIDAPMPKYLMGQVEKRSEELGCFLWGAWVKEQGCGE